MKRGKQNPPPPTALTVAMDANAAAYRRAVQTSAPGECWDFLVLTAMNEKQAEGYRQELALRERAFGPAGAFFPQIQRTLVVPDPPGHKAGSGGATLGAVRALVRECRLEPSDFDRLRILLIHSGGMSQRLPMYSALGKIFSPLPLLRPDGQIATLFDHLYLTLAGLPDRLGPGMLVLAGDVFLLFDHRHVSVAPPGVTAISMRVPAELGRGHGVFVTSGDGRIVRTLQKVSVGEMAQSGATDAAGRVLIDTGLLFFDPLLTRTLSELSRRIGPGTEVDLYDDVTAALASGTPRSAYLRAGRSAPVRRRLWKALHGVPFNLMEVAGEFLHLGTTRQFRDAMVGRHASPAAALFQQNVLTHTDWDLPANCRVYQSVLSAGREGERGSIGPGSVIEHSDLSAGCRIGAGCVVSQAQTKNPIELGDNLLLFLVPLGADARDIGLPFAQVVCGVDDDFKGRVADGKCGYLNRPIDEWFARHGIGADEVWPHVNPPDRTLWNARLFVAVSAALDPLPLQLAGPQPATKHALLAWRMFPRYSMADILEAVEPARLIEQREKIAADLQTRAALEVIRSGGDRPVEPLIGHFTTWGGYRESVGMLTGMALKMPPSPSPSDWLTLARSFWVAGQLLRRPDHPAEPVASTDPDFPVSPEPPADLRAASDEWVRRAFDCVASASEAAHVAAIRPRGRRSPRPALRPGFKSVATAPARLDLAGGWSDTPPYCFERGGHVVNVAIDLDDRPPVTATVTTLNDLVLILESHDLAKKIVLSDGDAAGPVDVGDPFALQKVALRTSGLLAEGVPLRRQLKSLGAGLHVSTEARVPKGSGLGTSSILGAALLAALHAAAGRKASPRQLIDQTLVLEQRLSTGGGWQDQVGGVAPGVKSTVTAPGVPQRPKVEVLGLSDANVRGLEERLVVYYSGQQRLARDILRRVMGRWLAREPAVIELMDSLKQSAAALRLAMLRGNWTAAAEQINRYWQIKKDLYPGSTTPAIDLLFLETRDDCLAAGLSGAGGGGFAYFLCKDKRHAAGLRARLAERSAQPGSMGSVYETRINREGLRVRRRRAE